MVPAGSAVLVSHLPRSTRSAVVLLIPVILSAVVPMDGLRPARPPSAVVKTTCDVLTAHHSMIIAGTSGTILFSCAEEAALIVRKPGTLVPTFSLPQGYVRLTLVPYIQGDATCSGGQELVPSQAAPFANRGLFDYCAAYSDAPVQGLESFQVAWST